jgi:DNA-binding Lrp family transcriptional regulator
MATRRSPAAAEEQLRLMVKVARLYHEHGIRQPEIARRLHVSQARVSRLLKQAELDGIVRTTVVVPAGVQTALEEGLEERYVLREAVVVELLDESEAGYITQADYQAGLEALGYAGNALQLELELGAARQAKKYRDAVVEAIHKAYLEHELDDSAAISQLATVGVTGDQATRLLTLWRLERQYTRTRLTEAQVVKAYGKSLITEQDALARLADFGLSAADAATRLAEG